MKQDKLVFSSALSATITVLAIAAITLGAEWSAPFKNYLKGVTGHHWITKSYLTILLYLVLWSLVYSLTKRLGPGKVAQTINWMNGALLVGSVAIFVFYIWHYLIA